MRIHLASLALLALPALAHHSFEAEYDIKKTMQVTGVVTKWEWMNPHARFYVDVKDESGAVVNWNFELGSPNVLRLQGWTRDALKVGDKVTVDAFLAKDGSRMANARQVVLSDGRKVFAGSSSDGAK